MDLIEDECCGIGAGFTTSDYHCVLLFDLSRFLSYKLEIVFPW
jgi:hypothetical protein